MIRPALPPWRPLLHCRTGGLRARRPRVSREVDLSSSLSTNPHTPSNSRPGRPLMQHAPQLQRDRGTQRRCSADTAQMAGPLPPPPPRPPGPPPLRSHPPTRGSWRRSPRTRRRGRSNAAAPRLGVAMRTSRGPRRGGGASADPALPTTATRWSSPAARPPRSVFDPAERAHGDDHQRERMPTRARASSADGGALEPRVGLGASVEAVVERRRRHESASSACASSGHSTRSSSKTIPPPPPTPPPPCTPGSSRQHGVGSSAVTHAVQRAGTSTASSPTVAPGPPRRGCDRRDARARDRRRSHRGGPRWPPPP